MLSILFSLMYSSILTFCKVVWQQLWRGGERFDFGLIRSSFLNSTVKKLWKVAYICRSYIKNESWLRDTLWFILNFTVSWVEIELQESSTSHTCIVAYLLYGVETGATGSMMSGRTAQLMAVSDNDDDADDDVRKDGRGDSQRQRRSYSDDRRSSTCALCRLRRDEHISNNSCTAAAAAGRIRAVRSHDDF